jgi:hypothetical protein
MERSNVHWLLQLLDKQIKITLRIKKSCARLDKSTTFQENVNHLSRSSSNNHLTTVAFSY